MSNLSCNQTLMCGHPDSTTFGIFLSLIVVHVIYLFWLCYQFRRVIINRSLRSIRVILQYLCISLFIILSIVYYCGIFFEYGQVFYYLSQNIPGIFYDCAIIVYLSYWLQFTFKLRYKHPQVARKNLNCADKVILSFSFFLIFVFGILVTLGTFKGNLRLQVQTSSNSALLYFNMSASSLLGIGYLVVMILVLRTLKKNYSALYYKLRAIVIFATTAEFLGLTIKVCYIIVTLVFNVPSEQNSKYAEIPIRILLSFVPLSISLVISVAVVQINNPSIRASHRSVIAIEWGSAIPCEQLFPILETKSECDSPLPTTSVGYYSP